jgi:hypothetical protein
MVKVSFPVYLRAGSAVIPRIAALLLDKTPDYAKWDHHLGEADCAADRSGPNWLASWQAAAAPEEQLS